MMQQAAVDYVRNPGTINTMLTQYTTKIKGGTPVSAAGAADEVQRMLTGLIRQVQPTSHIQKPAKAERMRN